MSQLWFRNWNGTEVADMTLPESMMIYLTYEYLYVLPGGNVFI